MRYLYTYLTFGLLLVFSCLQTNMLMAQENCDIVQAQNEGYTTSISNVSENGDGTYTIVIILENDGCSGCKKLNRFSVEADPGTYSDIEVQLLSGNFTYANIDLGPDIGGGLTGFRINNANGMGNGQAAAFSVTYTLSGGLQDQQFVAKAGPFDLAVSYTAEDFQAVLDCLNPAPSDILPYYDPLGVGKINDIIGYELTSLYVAYQEGSFVAEEVADIYRVIGETVLITVQTQPDQFELALAELTGPTYGLTNPIGNLGTKTIQGLYPIDNLLLMNDRPDILVSASPVFPALGNSGLVVSQGDTAMRSYIARDVFKVNGTGIKVGVISDSYNTKLGDQASDDIIKGDLPGADNPDFPAPVDVILEYPYGEASDEGRAMLQIVHDVAPGAELAFRTGFAGPVDFAAGINQLQQAGCDIIVDDITYINEPFFRDGIVAQAVDNVTALGVSYFSAAGNFGTNSWEGNFNPVPSPAGLPGDAHNFAPGGSPVDISQNVKLYQGQYTVVMQWDDGTPGLNTSSDFDIYLANNSDIAFFGFNRANINGAPIEVLPFTVVADSTETNFQIIRAATAAGYDGSQPTILKYIVFRGILKINEYGDLNASTITGQANAAGAMAVGAVLYTNTPEFGEPAPTVASFSSRGSTPVNGVFRAKPEFCAPNVVNTSVDLGGGFDFEGDGFPNFVGTSAAAPHAAGVAALVLQAREKYYEDNLSPLDLKAILQNTALDMYAPGYDVESGAGYILADSALKNLANPSAFLITVTYDTTLVPGFEEIPITISGAYLTQGSEVYFNGQPLEATSSVEGDTVITVILPTYSDTILYPEIQVNNPSREGTNGLDGGLSNVVYLTTKTTIFVEIQDVQKTYGETLPEFTANYFRATLDGNEPIEAAGLTQEELNRVQSVGLTTIANSLSNVGLWAIEPDPNDPLNPLSGVEASDPLDLSLLERFNFVFSNGLMTIDPLEIVIDPKDTTIVFNEAFVGFDFNYLFNNNNDLNISPEDSSAISNAVRLIHGTALVNRPAALIQGTALVNEFGGPLLTEEILANKSIMISSALRLVQGTALVNGSLLDPESFYDAAALPNAAARLVQGTALVNALRLVQGTALVNEFDESGGIINAFPLVQGTALVNSGSSEIGTSTFNADSNSETIVILGEGDIEILSGEAEGTVDIESVHLVTGDEVGTHFILPGAFISNNFVISYLVGGLTVIPDTAFFEFNTESLTQIYDGSPKEVVVIANPDTVTYAITYNGQETIPVDAGSYEVEVVVTNDNYFGSATATLTILPAAASVEIDEASTTQVFDGSGKAVSVTTNPEGLALAVTYDGSADLPINAGTYAVQVIVTNPNYTGSASGSLTIEKAVAGISIGELTQTYDGLGKSVSVSTTPIGLGVSVSYNDSENLPVNAGSYAVQVDIVDANYEGSATAVLVIEKAEASVVLLELDQVYDGNPKPINGSTSPTGLSLLFSYDGASDAPVDAGSYPVSAYVEDPNYFGSAEGTLNIEKALASIEFSDLEQVYSGAGISVSLTTTPPGLNVDLTYDGETALPENAGSYLAEAVINDNNYVGAASVTLVITQATADISFANLVQTYDGLGKSITANTVPSGLNLTITYDGSEALPVNAGSYTVDVTVNETNYIGSASETLTIDPAEATASAAGIYFTDEDGDLPEFSVSYSGFVNGEDESVVSSITYEFSPNYSGNAGTYEVIPVPIADNYSFAVINGTFYVNPSGPGTKQVKPNFICSEELAEPDADGFTHIAYFDYENKNQDNVYVPIGLENEITGTSFNSENQPALFLVGGGSITVPFDGSDLTWQVTSNKNNGTKGAIPANSSNAACSKSIDDPSSSEPEFTLYPNPTSGKVFIQVSEKSKSAVSVDVYDSSGRWLNTESRKVTGQLYELDLSPYSSGLYFIKITHESKVEMQRVIRE